MSGKALIKKWFGGNKDQRFSKNVLTDIIFLHIRNQFLLNSTIKLKFIWLTQKRYENDVKRTFK